MAPHAIVRDSILINGFDIAGGQMCYEDNRLLPYCSSFDKLDLAFQLKLRRKHFPDEARHWISSLLKHSWKMQHGRGSDYFSPGRKACGVAAANRPRAYKQARWVSRELYT